MKLVKGYSQWLNENFSIANSMFEWKASEIINNNGFAYITTFGMSNTDGANGLTNVDMTKFLGTDAGADFKKFEQDYRGTNTNNPVAAKEILASLLTGSVKKKFLGLFKRRDAGMISQALGLVGSGQLSINYDSEAFNYNVDPKDSYNRVLTRGQVSGLYKLDPKPRNGKSSLLSLISFINAYNVNAYALNLPQYCLSARVEPPAQTEGDLQGFIDLEKVAGTYQQYEVGDASSTGILYVYSTKMNLGQSAAGDYQSDDKSTGGTVGATGQYETDFLKSKSDCTTIKVGLAVKKAAHEIAQLWPAGKGPDTFNLTSGASADWNGSQLPESTGTGTTFTGKTENEKANQKLAYDRGFNFMTAVNAALVKIGHPGFPKFVVSWVIGNTGGPAKNGKYVDLMLETQAVQPTITTVTKYVSTVSGATSTGKSVGTLYEFKLSIIGATKVGTPALPNP